MNENELICAAQAGDTNAASELLKLYYKQAIGRARYLSYSDDNRVYDAVQDAMVRAWRKIKLYNQTRGKFYTWLMTVVTFSSIKQAQKEKWRSRIAQIDYIDEQHNAWIRPKLVSSTTHSESDLEYSLLVYDVFTELLVMSEPQRTIMAMFLDGYSYQEIMAITGNTFHSVNSHIKRAKKKLQKALS